MNLSKLCVSAAPVISKMSTDIEQVNNAPLLHLKDWLCLFLNYENYYEIRLVPNTVKKKIYDFYLWYLLLMSDSWNISKLSVSVARVISKMRTDARRVKYVPLFDLEDLLG